MSGGLDPFFELQRELLDLQKKQVEAAEGMIKAGDDMAAFQEESQKAVKAALEANRAWLRFWGWK